MAGNSNIEVKVYATNITTGSFESAIIKGIRDLAIKMRDEHGICIRDINIEWLDISVVGGHDAVIKKINLSTTTSGE